MANKLSIKQLRVVNNLTQFEMAEILDISITSYSLKELGKRMWSFDEIVRLKKYFNIKIDDLIEVEKILNTL